MPLVRSELVAEYGAFTANPAFPSPFTPQPIRAVNLAPKARRLIRREIIRGLSWMLTESTLGPSASVVRRSVSFALHGHEPFHVVAATPAARFTDD